MADYPHKTPPTADEVPPVSTPYGPQHGHVDEAAGGADSSPYENEPTGGRMNEAQNPSNANVPGMNEPHRKG